MGASLTMNDAVPPAPTALSAAALRWRCEPTHYPCVEDSTRCGPGETVGQDRAVEAFTLGLEIDAPGYNIFVTGVPGSGRTSTITRLLERLTKTNRRQHDRAYVHNFADHQQPKLLTFEPGRARKFERAMAELVVAVREEIAKAFDDSAYTARRKAITAPFVEEEKTLAEGLEADLSADKLALVSIQSGPMSMQAILPVIDGKPVPLDILQRTDDSGLSEDELAEIERKIETHRERFDTLLAQGRRLRKKAARAQRGFDTDVARGAIAPLVEDVATEFPQEDVKAHLDGVLEHLCDHGLVFRSLAESNEDVDLDLGVYQVNVLEEELGDEAPVVVERHPSFANLFGSIERRGAPDGAATDFRGIRGGSLLRADGGYLIMYARDVLTEPGVWRTLARVLRSQQLEIQTPETALYLAPTALKPEPIPLTVKVILIGSPSLYGLLLSYEEEFGKIFKVKAELDTSVRRNERSVSRFLEVANQIVESEGLLALSTTGATALIEEAVRTGGKQSRLSVRFGEVADLLREANHAAHHAAPPSSYIDGEAVRGAVAARRRRHGLLDEKINQAMVDEVILVDTAGARVGQINGLAVYGSGDERFGKPARITASVGAGRGGLVNIEREAKLSGPSHDKGVLILSGYLLQSYGAERPLTLRASIAFEQSYGGIDGDSASGAEMCCLLSALTGLPLRQDIAMTGAIDQVGHILAIGAANEKIEGFYDACEEIGATSTQGVIIPKANARDLMLRGDVVDACENGRFSIYAVDTIHEALGILTGIDAGMRGKDGRYPEGTVLAAALKRAKEYWEKVQYRGR